MNEPTCRNHPDRFGVSHYGRPYSYSLCKECRDRRLEWLNSMPLDDNAARIIPHEAEWPEDLKCLTG